MKKFLLAVLCVIFVLVCIGTCGSLMSSNSVNSSVDSDTVAVDTSTLMTEDQHPITKKSWDLSTSQDDMDDSKNYWYSLQSDNYANFDFPYEGNSYLTITVRWMKKYGYDVLLEITKGQMVGNEYNGTNYVRVRFDGGKVQKFYYNEPNEGV